MAGIKKANGHRPSGLLHLLDPSLKLAPHPRQDEVSFNLENTLNSVVRLSAEVPEDSFSARTLGTERQGNAVLVSDDGLLLTIGYLVVDARTINLHGVNGQDVKAELVGYNHESGFALIHALSPLDLPIIQMGTAEDLVERESVIVAPYGGVDHAIQAVVVSRREFAGAWEYLLDSAIFTAPIHPNWSGAALIRQDGTLCGVGSLWVNDAETGKRESPGNMFAPIDLLTPIYDDLISTGQAKTQDRPWLGMYTAEAMGRLFVSGIIPDGPADQAGVEPGDLITGLNDEDVTTMADMYRRLWSLGPAGLEITLNLRRDSEDIDALVATDSRYSFLERRKSH